MNVMVEVHTSVEQGDDGAALMNLLEAIADKCVEHELGSDASQGENGELRTVILAKHTPHSDKPVDEWMREVTRGSFMMVIPVSKGTPEEIDDVLVGFEEAGAEKER